MACTRQFAAALVVVSACAAPNHAPTLMPPVDAELAVGDTLEVDLVADDPDEDDRLAFKLVTAPSEAALDGDTITWSPAAVDVGSHPFVVEVSDDGDPALEDHAAFAVTVYDPTEPPPNHAPTLVPPSDMWLDAGTALSMPITADDPDGDTLTIALVEGPSGAGISSGTLAWTPTVAQVGPEAFVVSATDDGTPVMTDFAAFTITVVDPDAPPPNHPPSLTPPVDRAIAAGSQLSVTLLANDPDGDDITYALADGPTAAALTSDTLTWTPGLSDLGANGFVVSATDDGVPALADWAVFTVSVYDPNAPGVNHPPEPMPAPDQVVAADQELSFQVYATDPDPIDILTWEAVAIPTGSDFDASTRTFSWTPTASDVGAYFAVFGVTDDGEPELTSYTSVRIDVVMSGAEDGPPVFVSLPAPGTLEPCVLFQASFEAVDPEGGPVTYEAVLPDGAEMVQLGTTGVIEWTPTAADVGTYDVVVWATDDSGRYSAVPYTMVVDEVPPFTLTPTEIVVDGGDLLDVTLDDGQACYSVDLTTSVVPGGLAWDDETDTLTWQTERADFGLYWLHFESDGPAAPGDDVLVTVRYADPFTAFEGYTLHEVYWPGEAGPVTWTVEGDGQALDGARAHSSSAHGDDVLGRAFESFDRTFEPIAAVDWEVRGYDSVVGPACGSGGALVLYDFVVDDPAATWPEWYTDPEELEFVSLTDGTDYAVLGGNTLVGGYELTPVLFHYDASNVCTVDAYWDSVVITPLLEGPQL